MNPLRSASMCFGDTPNVRLLGYWHIWHPHMWGKKCTFTNYNLAASAATAVLKKKKKSAFKHTEDSHINCIEKELHTNLGKCPHFPIDIGPARWVDSIGMLSGPNLAISRQIQWSAHGPVPVISQNPQEQMWFSRTKCFSQMESHSRFSWQSRGNDIQHPCKTYRKGSGRPIHSRQGF